jgi:hypothetical protein
MRFGRCLNNFHIFSQNQNILPFVITINTNYIILCNLNYSIKTIAHFFACINERSSPSADVMLMESKDSTHTEWKP